MLATLLRPFRRKSTPTVEEVEASVDRMARIKAKYDAAQTSADNSNHWSQSDNLSPDAANSKAVREVLRKRSRYEVGSNSYAQGIVKSIADITIGTGPRLQLLTGHEKTNDEIENEWLEWTHQIGLAEKLRTHRMARCGDGEAFLQFFTNPRVRHSVKLDLQGLEADHITDPTLKGLANEVDGIRYDEYGNPSEYLVKTHHPGSDVFYGEDDFRIVDASQMIHSFRSLRPGQHRGIPELTSALPLFAQLRRYTLAVLAAAESAANFALVIESNGPANDEDAAPDPLDEIELSRNMATTLPNGYHLGQVKAEQPVTTYGEFKKEILGEIARCLCIPKSIALGDSVGLNYSSGRLDHQSFFRAVDVDRSYIETHELDRIFAAWLFEYQLARSTFRHIPIAKLPAHTWFWDGLLHVDPEKEAKAQKIRLENGTTTYAREFSRNGEDWLVQFNQRAKEQAVLTELGLEFGDKAAPMSEPDENQGDDEDE